MTGILISELDFPAGITASKHHSANDLVAISCANNVVRVVDVETKNVIRELHGCLATVNDFVRATLLQGKNELIILLSASQMMDGGYWQPRPKV